jgi:hypothetical protein
MFFVSGRGWGIELIEIYIALPPGKISHVDIVNSGLEVADRIPPWKTSPSTSASQSRIRIESLRLMSNKIRHIGEHIFRYMHRYHNHWIADYILILKWV